MLNSIGYPRVCLKFPCSRGTGFQFLNQGRHTLLQQIQHLIEALLATIIRIRDRFALEGGNVIAEQCDFMALVLRTTGLKVGQIG